MILSQSRVVLLPQDSPGAAAPEAEQQKRAGLEEDKGTQSDGGRERARLAARASVRARKTEQDPEGGQPGGQQQTGGSSQVWHVIYSMWRG